MSHSKWSSSDNSTNDFKLVILDRDGVINHDSDEYIKTPDEWLPINGSIEAIAKLCKNGFRVAVATNQSGIARNYFPLSSLEQIHHKMRSMVEASGGKIDGIFFCPHHPDDHCQCRKPETGLLEQIASSFNTSLCGVPFIGDSYKDIQAARKCECRPILVRTGKGQSTIEQAEKGTLADVAIVNDLAAAVELITGD